MAAAGGGAAAGRAYSFKVVLLGEGCVGKTSLVLRYCENKFNDKHITTLQVRALGGGSWRLGVPTPPEPGGLYCNGAQELGSQISGLSPPSNRLSEFALRTRGVGAVCRRKDRPMGRGERKGPEKSPVLLVWLAAHFVESPSLGWFFPFVSLPPGP